MKSLKNSVRLTGNMGRNVEMHTFSNGNKKASFSIATSDNYVNKDAEVITQTFWHNIVAYGKLAELMEKLLTKGNQISIEGRLTNRSYEHDGIKRYVTEIEVREFLKLKGTKSEEASPIPAKDPFE